MKGLDLIIPAYLREFIDQHRSSLSRSRYILDCIRYIRDHSIDVTTSHEPNEGKITNDRTEEIKRTGEVFNRGDI